MPDRTRLARFRMAFSGIRWYTAEEIAMKCDWCDTPLHEAGHATLGICYSCAHEEGII